MAYDKNKSPVAWYLGTYLLRIVEMDGENRNDPNKRFSSWKNTVFVKATSLASAYGKVQKTGNDNSKPYRGRPDGIRVRWAYCQKSEFDTWGPLIKKIRFTADS